MINPLLLHSLSQLRRHWLVTILTILGIGMGTAVIIAVLLANESALRSFTNAIIHIKGKNDLTIANPSGTTFSDEQLDRLHLVSPALPFRISPILTKQVYLSDNLLFLRGMDLLSEMDGHHGGGPDILTRKGALLAPGGLARYHLTKGEVIKVDSGTRTIPLRIEGELPRTESTLLMPSNTLVMDISWVQSEFHENGQIDRLDLFWRGNHPLTKSLLAFWQQKLQALAGPGLKVESPRMQHREYARLLDSYRSNLLALSLVSLIVGMFLIYNTLSLLVIQRQKEFSTLRLLGATPDGLLAMILLEGTIFGILGGAVGIFLGHLLSHLTIRSVAGTLSAIYLPPHIMPHLKPRGADLPVFLLTVVASVFSALFPARQAMKASPSMGGERPFLESRIHSQWKTRVVFSGLLALLGGLLLKTPPVHGFPWGGYFGALALVFAVSLLVPPIVILLGLLLRWLSPPEATFPEASGIWSFATGQFVFGISRSQVAISAVMIGLSMMIGISVLVGSFEKTLNTWILQNLVANIYVKPFTCKALTCRDTLPPDLESQIASWKEVDMVAPYTLFPISLSGQKVWLGFSPLNRLIRKAPLSIMNNHPKQIVRVFSEGKGVLISESFSYHQKKYPGDRLIIPTPDGPRSYRILALFHDYQSSAGLILLPWSEIQPLFHTDRPGSLSIFLKSPSDTGKIMTRLSRDIPGHPAFFLRSQSGLNHRVMRIFHQSFAITYALLGISLLVSILGVGNTLFLLTYERKWEMKLLRILGFTQDQIGAIILLEAFFMGLAGTLLGIFLGTAVGYIIVYVINREAFGWTLSWVWPAGRIALLSMALLFSATLAGLIPWFLATRTFTNKSSGGDA